MFMPPGYEKIRKYCKSKKTFYVLKQFLKLWFEKIKNMMKRYKYDLGNVIMYCL